MAGDPCAIQQRHKHSFLNAGASRGKVTSPPQCHVVGKSISISSGQAHIHFMEAHQQGRWIWTALQDMRIPGCPMLIASWASPSGQAHIYFMGASTRTLHRRVSKGVHTQWEGLSKGYARWASPYLFQVDKPISISWSINNDLAYAYVLLPLPPPEVSPLLIVLTIITSFVDLKPASSPVHVPVFVFVYASHLEVISAFWNTWLFREHLIQCITHPICLS